MSSGPVTVCPHCGESSSEDYDGRGTCWECHSAHTQEQSVPGTAVGFISPSELQASIPPEPPWIWDGYLARGAVTILAGKPKAGKSTLAFSLANATANFGAMFLGHELINGPVVYISEEGAATLAHKVGDGDLRLATRETAWPKPDWSTLVAAAVAEAKRVDAVLLVIDTFAAWASLGPEAEKDAGAVQAAMEPVVQAARSGLAVLLILHSRKGGGEDGEGVRGSSALAGAADIVLELERVQGGPARQRKLLALSRYPQTPGVLVIEHEVNQGRWRVIGEGADRADARDISDRVGLLSVIPDSEEGITRKELIEAMGSPELQWHAVLDQLISDGHVGKTGEGKRGNPYRYKKLRGNSAHAPAQQSSTNETVGVSLVSAQLPLKAAQNKETTAAVSAASLRCAETDTDAADTDGLDADAELARISAKFGDFA